MSPVFTGENDLKRTVPPGVPSVSHSSARVPASPSETGKINLLG